MTASGAPAGVGGAANPATGSAPSGGAPPTSPSPERIERKRSHGLAVVAVVVVVVVVVAALGAAYELHWIGPKSKSSPPGTCPTGVTLTGAGASFLEPLMSQWVASFDSATGNPVSYTDSGAGAGITALQGPTVDFAATDDPLNASQIAGFKGDPLLTMPIAAGALAIVYNLPGITSPITLSGPVLAEIYTGAVTSWNSSSIRAINPGVNFPNATIITVHRQDAAGTTYVLSNFLSDDNASWKSTEGTSITIDWPTAPTQRAITGNSALAKFVQGTADTIGYVDLTDVLNTPGLQYAKVLNPSGKAILPSLQDAGSAIRTMSANISFPALNDTQAWTTISMVNSPAPADYPLTTLVYAFVYLDLNDGYQSSLAKSQVIWEWLNWTSGVGQNEASPLYYVPLPSVLVTDDHQGLSALRYDSAALPTCS